VRGGGGTLDARDGLNIFKIEIVGEEELVAVAMPAGCQASAGSKGRFVEKMDRKKRYGASKELKKGR